MSAGHVVAPLVSVIIPTRNRAHLVLDAIASVRSQTYATTEIIVVDDASEDDTVARVSQLPDVRLVRLGGAGQGAARNAGFALSRGDLIATLDSDDIWYPTFLAQCVRALQDGVHDLVFCNWDQQVPGEADVGGLERYRELRAWFPPGRSPGWQRLEPPVVRSLFFATCPTPSSGMVFRRAAVPQSCPWIETLRIADDWCLALDLVSKSERSVGFTTAHLWRKRIDGSNICDGRAPMELLQHLRVADRSFQLRRFGGLVPPPELAKARLRLARNRMQLATHMFRKRAGLRTASMHILDAARDEPMLVVRWFRDVLRRRLGRVAARARGAGARMTVAFARGRGDS